MNTRHLITIICASGLIVTAAQASYSSSVDSDGCWDGRNVSGGKCVYGTSRWNDDAYIATMTNRCSHRVYVRFCNERSGDRSPDCGASGIRAGSDHTWRTGSNATGRTAWNVVGSETPSKDWVCAGKVRNWRRDLF